MREEEERGRGESRGETNSGQKWRKLPPSFPARGQLSPRNEADELCVVTYLNITLWKETLFSILQFSLPPAITNIL